jgi:deoxyribodipyrimidine photo-lyase
MHKDYTSALVWFRRDLRATDHAALYQALKAADRVHCAFVFDSTILLGLPRRDRRLEFIRDSVEELQGALEALGGPGTGLITVHGAAAEEIPALARQLGVQAVFANHDYEEPALARDLAVRERLAADGIALHTSKDQVVFEREEVLTQAGKPYSVFTPYSRAWLAKLDAFYLKPYPVKRYASALAPRPPEFARPVPSLEELGFETTNLRACGFAPGASGAEALLRSFGERVDRYDTLRDLPASDATSHLSVHLRFGTVSIRRLAALAWQRKGTGAQTWLKELVWRDFYFQVLANFPQVNEGRSFKREYDGIAWEQGAEAEALFAAWCEGRTGYPLVDAAMAQINETGFMHNRLRMVTASFLCKDLGIDWRRGERYFAEKLNDYDFAANNGGWQWASSSGCDAQPYFRIFNPVSQGERFDAQGEFIAQWLPQLAALPPALRHAPWKAGPLELAAAGVELGQDYPRPIVDHAVARETTLRRYAVVKTG